MDIQMEAKMKKILSVTCAAMLLAASVGFAAAHQYPLCTSRSDDNCMQVGAKMSIAASSEFDIPHGCSPATTPCE